MRNKNCIYLITYHYIVVLLLEQIWKVTFFVVGFLIFRDFIFERLTTSQRVYHLS